MGLGKTLSVLALIASSRDALDYQGIAKQGSTSRPTLIITPKSSVYRGPNISNKSWLLTLISDNRMGDPNWKVHTRIQTFFELPLTTIFRHFRAGGMKFGVYHGPSRERLLSQFSHLDIVLSTYETMRSSWLDKNEFCQTKWHRVVLDEGKLKNVWTWN